MIIRNSIFVSISIFLFVFTVTAQKTGDIYLDIVRAEDELRYDAVVEKLLTHPDQRIRIRAALAAGRIGDENALQALATILERDSSELVKAMAAFALGEIESIAAADVIMKILRDAKTPAGIRARAVEAAGKIAAANPDNESAKKLGEAILDTLEAEDHKGDEQNHQTVLLALTAALRARPPETDFLTAKFLTNRDARIRADAANTLARIRAKNANDTLREMVARDDDPIARANAARALGAADDKDAGEILLRAATADVDSRVRVSAIRAVAQIAYSDAAEPLLDRGSELLKIFGSTTRPVGIPEETNELLEIVAALGRLLAGTGNEKAIRFLSVFGENDHYRSPETEIAFAKIAPARYPEYAGFKKPEFKQTRAAIDAALVGTRELAVGSFKGDVEIQKNVLEQLRRGLTKYRAGQAIPAAINIPQILRALAAFKPEGLEGELRLFLDDKDVFIRAAAADLLADQPSSKENIDALGSAFAKSLVSDKHDNDAQLSILSALVKLDKGEARESLKSALAATDYLVRRHAADLIKQNGLQSDFPGFEKMSAPVRRYDPKSGTKLGHVLNRDADYRRAIARKNGTVRAVLTTQKGSFTIEFLPEDAPLTVDNFIKLARLGYFNGLEVHRVVANFVVQDGDPRGDGNGGPGWSIRDEINMVPYGRGAVGMALSGKNTGGSQWFVTHSPQPHLDGGYTVFGRVNETDMKIVDKITRGDRILSVKIITQKSPRK